ncbi:MAG: phosphonate C-P lyase system protein PhnH [Sarcina sp.]
MQNIELVHFMQESYRRILDSMSRPAKVNKLDEIKSPIDFNFGSFIIMRVFLDTETKFHIVCDNKDLNSEKIAMITKASEGSIENSDFIFVGIDKQKELPFIIENARKGTLVDPHLGATIICEVDEILLGKRFSVSGPGVNGDEIVSLPISEFWKSEREEAISDYPRGIDLIFVDKSGQIIAVPRTTKVIGEV